MFVPRIRGSENTRKGVEVEGSMCWGRQGSGALQYFFDLLFTFFVFCFFSLSPLTVDEERDEGTNDVDGRDTALF